MNFQSLGEMRLTWRSKCEAPSTAKFGKYQGRGDGEYLSSDLVGTVAWDLFEVEGSETCDASLVGQISAEDDAAVNFEALGFFRRQRGANVWTHASAVRFASESARYSRYQNLLGIMTGTFDMGSYQHNYVIHLPESGELAERSI